MQNSMGAGELPDVTERGRILEKVRQTLAQSRTLMEHLDQVEQRAARALRENKAHYSLSASDMASPSPTGQRSRSAF
jgi:hypothetical protein